MKTFITENAEETFALGERIGRALKGKETIALEGEPGAGKTVLTKGIAKGLGVTDLVTSPTFTILNEYEGRAKLFHYDMYRISDPEELGEVGFSERLGEGVTVVEWSENIRSALPVDAVFVAVDYLGEKRRVTVYADTLL